MEVFEAIKSRTSVRAFQDKPIDPVQFAKILEAGRWAPSPLDSQPWHFIIVQNKDTLLKFSEKAMHGRFIKLAPIVVVVISKEDLEHDSFLTEHDQYAYSSAVAMHNMVLTAWEMGIGSCWVSLEDKSTKALLEIPQNYKLLGCLALGYPKMDPPEHIERDRKSLLELISQEKFTSTK